MQNPFNHENYPSNDLKRNPFPCSFQTNLTMKYGYIYPAGIWRTVPGATYKIQPTLGLNFMPTTFPVQTRQKVYVHYFYGRDRNFWKDYKDFVNGQRPDLVKPYIDESVTKARTGKLLDYLGVPTTIIGSYANYDNSSSVSSDSDLNTPIYISGNLNSADLGTHGIIDFNGLNRSDFLNGVDPDYSSRYSFVDWSLNFENVNPFDLKSVKIQILPSSSFSGFTALDDYMNESQYSDYHRYDCFHLCFFDDSGLCVYDVKPSNYGNNGYLYFNIPDNISNVTSCSLVATIIRTTAVQSDNRTVLLSIFDRLSQVTITATGEVFDFGVLPLMVGISPTFEYSISMQHEVRDIDDTNSPYWRTGATIDLRERIKLNAYLPRMYETIYNLYYRNPQNNPYMLNGLPEYNKFIPSKDGGVDSNLYELRRRNWEDDFLTTAVQSPQQGIAPLVGLTDRGATLTLTNDDGSVTRYNVSVADNGSLTGIEATDTTAEPVLTRALIDAVSYGISIEDIRNVNAMQKWLELNLRKGYQYKDIIQARWGISISYNELDLPEFIGGFTRDVQLQAVTQTANVNDDVTGQLGWQGGRLFASGEGREITHYCDEEGFIMCLVTVVPVPNYSQLLPKHWIERDLLDSYQPEFNHIGFQPITYKEVCPVQAFQESTENINVLEQTFGYQRPWYQYFNYVDEVHGQFRTTFKDFLINRVFDVKPELSESFLLVDPEQINDVFNVTDPDDDKIVGAIYHNCVAKLPISLYAQARLE